METLMQLSKVDFDRNCMILKPTIVSRIRHYSNMINLIEFINTDEIDWNKRKPDSLFKVSIELIED